MLLYAFHDKLKLPVDNIFSEITLIHKKVLKKNEIKNWKKTDLTRTTHL
jgi:hypothetical protein